MRLFKIIPILMIVASLQGYAQLTPLKVNAVGTVNLMAKSPENKYLLTYDMDNTAVNLFNLNQKSLIQTIQLKPFFPEIEYLIVQEMAFSPDSELLALQIYTIDDQKNHIYVIESKSSKVISKINLTENNLRSKHIIFNSNMSLVLHGYQYGQYVYNFYNWDVNTNDLQLLETVSYTNGFELFAVKKADDGLVYVVLKNKKLSLLHSKHGEKVIDIDFPEAINLDYLYLQDDLKIELNNDLSYMSFNYGKGIKIIDLKNNTSFEIADFNCVCLYCKPKNLDGKFSENGKLFIFPEAYEPSEWGIAEQLSVYDLNLKKRVHKINAQSSKNTHFVTTPKGVLLSLDSVLYFVNHKEK